MLSLCADRDRFFGVFGERDICSSCFFIFCYRISFGHYENCTNSRQEILRIVWNYKLKVSEKFVTL